MHRPVAGTASGLHPLDALDLVLKAARLGVGGEVAQRLA
jgi:hypothetical protein